MSIINSNLFYGFICNSCNSPCKIYYHSEESGHYALSECCDSEIDESSLVSCNQCETEQEINWHNRCDIRCVKCKAKNNFTRDF